MNTILTRLSAELIEKYRALATPVLGQARTARIEATIDSLATDAAALPLLLDALLDAVPPHAEAAGRINHAT